MKTKKIYVRFEQFTSENNEKVVNYMTNNPAINNDKIYYKTTLYFTENMCKADEKNAKIALHYIRNKATNIAIVKCLINAEEDKKYFLDIFRTEVKDVVIR